MRPMDAESASHDSLRLFLLYAGQVAMFEERTLSPKRRARLDRALEDPALRSALEALEPVRVANIKRGARRRMAAVVASVLVALVLAALLRFAPASTPLGLAWLLGAASLAAAAAGLIGWRIARRRKVSEDAAICVVQYGQGAVPAQDGWAALQATGLLDGVSGERVILGKRLSGRAGAARLTVDAFAVSHGAGGASDACDVTFALMFRSRLPRPWPGAVVVVGPQDPSPPGLERVAVADRTLDERLAIYASDRDVADRLSSPPVANALSALLREGGRPPKLSIYGENVALLLASTPNGTSAFDPETKPDDTNEDLALLIARAGAALDLLGGVQDAQGRSAVEGRMRTSCAATAHEGDRATTLKSGGR